MQNQRDRSYQRGQRDRDAGLLPKTADSAYLEGYLSDRPHGFDEVIRYFSTFDEFIVWQSRQRRKIC